MHSGKSEFTLYYFIPGLKFDIFHSEIYFIDILLHMSLTEGGLDFVVTRNLLSSCIDFTKCSRCFILDKRDFG
jgi:excinuclease UvrABC helicase subunit UvrB